MKRAFCFAIVLMVFACSESEAEKISVFHAGSLSVPLKKLKEAYEKKNSGVEILLEASGSVEAARKITDLKRKCDIMASADYAVIDEMLIPGHADFNIVFATNRMAIVFTEKAKYSVDINSGNWPEILLRKDVEYGHSDPDKDPCGYRTMLVWQLAEKHYGRPGLYRELIAGRPIKNIRPRETDLIALIQGGALDYIFLYKSVAVQHGLKYVELPDEINLSDPLKNNFYSGVSVSIRGKKPGESIVIKGQAMLYGITVLRGAPRRKEAVDFLNFILSREGSGIIKNTGQDPVFPPLCRERDKLYPEITTRVEDMRTGYGI